VKIHAFLVFVKGEFIGDIHKMPFGVFFVSIIHFLHKGI
jgi:hypothetical protein